MRRPLKRCCNGCDAPPHPPSFVLCKECFEKLNKKVEKIASDFGVQLQTVKVDLPRKARRP